MSGENVPYHLRQNKAVDRNLLVELLSKLNLFKTIEDYTYISFGGSFLEDFKLIHAYTAIKKMISLEENENVLMRQRFNLPINCIDLRQSTSGDFLASHSFEGNNIVWFDYARPSDLEKQIGETQFLVTQLSDGDIVKITLNANANTLADSQSLEIAKTKRLLKACNDSLLVTDSKAAEPIAKDISASKEELGVKTPLVTEKAIGPVALNEHRLVKFKDRAGKYYLADTEPSDMKRESYPNILCRTLKIAIQKAMDSKPNSYFQPLTAFSYADSDHTMLTYTGVILSNKNEDIASFFEQTRLRDWDLFQPDGDNAVAIRLPSLSLKERLKIDSLLPLSNESGIQAELGFFVKGDDEAESVDALKQYVRYYRQYPQFLKVSF